MFFNSAPSVKQFCRGLGQRVGLSRPLRALLVIFVMGTLLGRGKRSLAVLGRTVARESRYRGQVSRATRNADFRTRDLYRLAFDDAFRAEAVALKGNAAERTWVVSLDDVGTKRGGLTKIENGLHKRKAKKNPGAKQTPPSKSHTFVMGLLITDRGVRLPLPRKTWRTKKYARKIGKKYRKKPALAAEMLRELQPRIPAGVRVVVVADEAYEGKLLFAVCRELGFVFIAPVDARRCFGDVAKGDTSTERTLHARGEALPRSAFRRLVLARGKEETASYRRYTPDEIDRNEPRVFRVAHEARDVAGLGTVGVVYSWKSPVYRPRRDRNRETFKVLVCSDSSMSPECVVEWYDLRWQIELFFRELKSGLGLGSYTGTEFAAYERLVDVTMLSFLFLERQRLAGLASARAPVARAALEASRTAALKREIEREAATNDLAWLRASVETGRGRRRLRELLKVLRPAV